MKNIYVAGLAVVAYAAWQRGKRREAAKTEITEAEITDGSNWQGSLWQRLGGVDLVASGYRNLAGSTNAAPAFMEQKNIGLGRYAGWDGGL